MGIQVEFNPDLCLRAYGTKGRQDAECLPEKLVEGATYHFLKQGQRNYWLEGEIALRQTQGEQRLSKPIASIRIKEATHFLGDGKPYTRGKYEVIEVFHPEDTEPKFDGFERIRE